MKDKKVIFLILIILSFLLAVFIVHQFVEQRTLSEVYSQIIAWNPVFVESITVRCTAGNGSFFISESNIYPIPIRKSWQEISEDLPLLENSTWINFSQANSKPSHFPNHLHLGCEYTLQNLKDFKLAHSSHCPFYNFSNIGFNKSGSQALVFLSQFCGSHTVGALYLLDLVDGHWKVTDTLAIFME